MILQTQASGYSNYDHCSSLPFLYYHLGEDGQKKNILKDEGHFSYAVPAMLTV